MDVSAGCVIVESVDDDTGNVNFNGVEDGVGNVKVERSDTEGLTPTTVDLIKIIYYVQY